MHRLVLPPRRKAIMRLGGSTPARQGLSSGRGAFLLEEPWTTPRADDIAFSLRLAPCADDQRLSEKGSRPVLMTKAPFAPVRDEALAILARLGVPEAAYRDGDLPARSPITGEVVARVRTVTAQETTAAIGRAHEAFKTWRLVPAPRRGEFVRLVGEELRAAKQELGRLVTLETGKILSEGLGEVQEMIDI